MTLRCYIAILPTAQVIAGRDWRDFPEKTRRCTSSKTSLQTMGVKEIFSGSQKIQESKKSAEQELSPKSVSDMEQLMQCPCNMVLLFFHSKIQI